MDSTRLDAIQQGLELEATPLTDAAEKFGATSDACDFIHVDFARDLERAYNAACAFIDSHVADPDITDEMCRTYAVFCEKRKGLTQPA